MTSIALGFGGSAQASRPNPATKCKQARLLVTLKTNQAGPVKFRLHKKIGAEPTQSKFVEAWAKHDGKGFFAATYQETIAVTKTTAVQAMAEDLVNAIGLTTPWRSVTLHCTGAGGGGLASPQSGANPDQQARARPSFKTNVRAPDAYLGLRPAPKRVTRTGQPQAEGPIRRRALP